MITWLDIGHPPLSSLEAMIVLDRYLRALRSAGGGVLKVIHGRGKENGPPILKNTVKEWAFKRKKEILAVIPGEEFSVSDRTTETILRQYPGLISDTDLRNANTGATYIWISA